MEASAKRLMIFAALLSLTLISAGCSASANNAFFGATNPPRENVLRYVSGSEPESLDPQIATIQGDQRTCMALYEGLIEYDPKTGEPTPALAERWDVNKDSAEFVFHLRHDGRFSNGDPITARDFVYTIRRGLTPVVGSRNAAMAYPIKYAEAFNAGGVFVLDPDSKTYLLEKDFAEAAGETYEPADPTRVVLPRDEKKRTKAIDANPKLKAAAAGKQFVPVKAEDVGVEAVVSITLAVLAARQFSSGRKSVAAGWAVFIASMILFEILAQPARDRLRSAECRGLTGDDRESCLHPEPDQDGPELGLF